MIVGWVERSEPHQFLEDPWWGSLRSTHPTTLHTPMSALRIALFAALAAQCALAAEPHDPRGKQHIAIGIPNTLDTLKTFVEPEGCFSPGVGSYGVYFWIVRRNEFKVFTPALDGAKLEYGLENGAPIPWSRWRAGDVEVTTRLCQVERGSLKMHLVAAKVELKNIGTAKQDVALLVGLRPLGPAGGPIRGLAAEDNALLVDGRTAIVADQAPVAISLHADDIRWERLPQEILEGRKTAQESAEGNASGIMIFNAELAPGATQSYHFLCPVLPGRRAVGHKWDGTSKWAQFDLAELNPKEGGQLQPDLGLVYCRRLRIDYFFADARKDWRNFYGDMVVDVPDPRWGESLRAMAAHAALAMNEGAPDVAVVNYNVFNRDGVYVANILQKSGRFDLAAAAIDYFLQRPFNGRVEVEADNPGQVLWIMGEHWRFTRDRKWLESHVEAAGKLARMIEYYRTTSGPHYVKATSLDFGDALPPDKPDGLPADRKQELKPGRCDGTHPEYTEAFDIAGLDAAAALFKAAGDRAQSMRWTALSLELSGKYNQRFGAHLAKDYGGYCVLWPCRLFPLDVGAAFEQFQDIGAQQPAGWRYFPLAKAHQGLLAGNREAGHKTIAAHLDHEQMRGWYAFDEGGKSGAGGWRRPGLHTNWNGDVAMPHGWAIAEQWLLTRDSLVFEDGGKLVLLAGVPEGWFRGDKPIRLESVPTHFGPLSLSYSVAGGEASLNLGGAQPWSGYVVRLPLKFASRVTFDDRVVDPKAYELGDLPVPIHVKQVRLQLK